MSMIFNDDDDFNPDCQYVDASNAAAVRTFWEKQPVLVGTQYVSVGAISEIRQELTAMQGMIMTLGRIVSDMSAQKARCHERELEIEMMMAKCRDALGIDQPSSVNVRVDGKRLAADVMGGVKDEAVCDGVREELSRRSIAGSKTWVLDGPGKYIRSDVRVTGEAVPTIRSSPNLRGNILICTEEAPGVLSQVFDAIDNISTKPDWSVNVNEIKETGFVCEDQLAEFIKSLRNVDKDALYLMLHREGCRLDVHALEKFRKKS